MREKDVTPLPLSLSPPQRRTKLVHHYERMFVHLSSRSRSPSPRVCWRWSNVCSSLISWLGQEIGLENEIGRSVVSSSDSLRFSALDLLSLGLRLLSPRPLPLLLSGQIASDLLRRHRSDPLHSIRTMETIVVPRREILLPQSSRDETVVCPSALAPDPARRSSVHIESSVDHIPSQFSAAAGDLLPSPAQEQRRQRSRSSSVHRISLLQRFSSRIKLLFILSLSDVCSTTTRKSICSVLWIRCPSESRCREPWTRGGATTRRGWERRSTVPSSPIDDNLASRSPDRRCKPDRARTTRECTTDRRSAGEWPPRDSPRQDEARWDEDGERRDRSNFDVVVMGPAVVVEDEPLFVVEQLSQSSLSVIGISAVLSHHVAELFVLGKLLLVEIFGEEFLPDSHHRHARQPQMNGDENHFEEDPAVAFANDDLQFRRFRIEHLKDEEEWMAFNHRSWDRGVSGDGCGWRGESLSTCSPVDRRRHGWILPLPMPRHSTAQRGKWPHGNRPTMCWCDGHSSRDEHAEDIATVNRTNTTKPTIGLVRGFMPHRSIRYSLTIESIHS